MFFNLFQPMAKKKKKKAVKRPASLFKIASASKSYKAAKKRAAKANAAKKRAWKIALSVAKKKTKKRAR